MEKEALEKELREINLKNKEQIDQLTDTHSTIMSKINQVCFELFTGLLFTCGTYSVRFSNFKDLEQYKKKEKLFLENESKKDLLLKSIQEEIRSYKTKIESLEVKLTSIKLENEKLNSLVADFEHKQVHIAFSFLFFHCSLEREPSNLRRFI